LSFNGNLFGLGLFFLNNWSRRSLKFIEQVIGGNELGVVDKCKSISD